MKKAKRRSFTAIIGICFIIALCIIARGKEFNVSADSLDTVTGLTWESGSSATATWDQISEANYYKLKFLFIPVEASKEASLPVPVAIK